MDRLDLSTFSQRPDETWFAFRGAYGAVWGLASGMTVYLALSC